MSRNTPKQKRNPALTALRTNVLNAIHAALAVEWPQDKIDAMLDPSRLVIDDENNTVTFAGAVRVHVESTGRIEVSGLTEMGQRVCGRTEPIETLVTRYLDVVQREVVPHHFDFTVDEGNVHLLGGALGRVLSNPDNTAPDADQAPHWQAVRAAARGYWTAVAEADRAAVWVKLSGWLNYKLSKYAATRAGIGGSVHGLRVTLKLEVARMLEKDSRGKTLRNGFMWVQQIRELRPDAWDRLLRAEPIISQLKSDMPRLANLFCLTELRSCLFPCDDIEHPDPVTVDWFAMHPQDVLPTWRAKLLAAGLTPAGWRWLTRLAPNQLAALGNHLYVAIPVINLIVARQIEAGRFVSGWLRSELQWMHKRAAERELPVADVDVLIEATLKELAVRRKHFGPRGAAPRMADELHTIVDWLAPADFTNMLWHPAELYAEAGITIPEPDWYAAPRVIPKGAAHGWFVRKSAEWHARLDLLQGEFVAVNRAAEAWRDGNPEQAARILAASHAQLTWTSAIEKFSTPAGDIVPLTSALELAEEGIRMHHCVGSYTQYCAEDTARIFSVRRNGDSIATIELSPDDGGAWSVQQVQGPCNGEMEDARINDIAEQLARDYTAADKAQKLQAA